MNINCWVLSIDRLIDYCLKWNLKSYNLQVPSLKIEIMDHEREGEIQYKSSILEPEIISFEASLRAEDPELKLGV